MAVFAPCDIKGLDRNQYFAFGAGLETAAREKKVRAPLLANNLKQWKKQIRAKEFSKEVKCGSCKLFDLPVSKSSETNKSTNDQFSKVLQMDGLLLASECEALINAANAVGFMGTADLAALNFPEYVEPGALGSKNSARVLLVEDQELADVLWTRMQPTIMAVAEQSVLSSPYHDRIPLRAVGVCPLMRVLRYDAGGQFKPHKDGVDFFPRGPVSGEVCRSCLTIALYLNRSEDDSKCNDNAGSDTHHLQEPGANTFTGGAFRFLQPPILLPKAEAVALCNCTIIPSASAAVPLIPVFKYYSISDPCSSGGSSGESNFEVSPEVGRAVIFSQEEYHEGLPVYRGSKYMIQTSVMYECIPQRHLKADLKLDNVQESNFQSQNNKAGTLQQIAESESAKYEGEN